MKKKKMEFSEKLFLDKEVIVEMGTKQQNKVLGGSFAACHSVAGTQPNTGEYCGANCLTPAGYDTNWCRCV